MKTNIDEVVDKFLYSHAVEEGTQDERDLMKEIYNDKSYSVNRSSLIKFLKSSLTQQKEAIEKEWREKIEKEIERLERLKEVDGVKGDSRLLKILKGQINIVNQLLQ